jgi:phospholipid transport system substrate-binding protein
MRKPTLLFVCLSLLPVAAVAKEQPPAAPLAMMKWYNEHLDKILKKKGVGPESLLTKEDQATLRSLQTELFDYNELSKRALAAHWEKLTKPQQADFVKTLSEMIEKNYTRQLRSNVEYTVTYKKETVTDAEASVATTVKVSTKGKPTEAEIEYKLHKAGTRWMVYDVVTDEVSMVRNYKQQFNKVITGEGFDGLLAKLKKRIVELDKQNAGGTPAAPGPKEAKN